MSGNGAKVLVDLNAPTFQDDLFDLNVPDLKKVFKTLKKIRKMVWHDVFVDKGLHWEEMISMTGKYSIRLSSSYRAVVTREGSWMRLPPSFRSRRGLWEEVAALIGASMRGCHAGPYQCGSIRLADDLENVQK